MSKKSREFRKKEEAQEKAAPQQQIRVGIEPPPDYIFKYRKNRTAPAQDVWGAGGTISYIPQKAEYIEGVGNFVHHYGVPFPSKTVAPVEAIHAMAGSKRLTINALRLVGSIRVLDLFTRAGWGRILTNMLITFNDTADMMMVGFYLHDGYYCKLVKEIRVGVTTFLTSLGVERTVAEHTSEIIGCFFEYDNAYRTRIQDLAGETTYQALLENLPQELERLINIQATRETVPNGGQEVVKRFKAAVKVIKWVWKIPPTKKALKNAISSIHLDNCKMDEADIYHNLLYGDYNTHGKTLAERLEVLKAYHGPDETKWPPRILIRNTG